MNTLTTSSATLNIKSNQVPCKGNDKFIYLDAHLGGVMCWTDYYIDGMIKHRNGSSLGDQTSVGTWTSQCSISSPCIITTNGSISATGSIEGGSITTSSGNISSLSGSIQTRDGTVGGGHMDHFQNLSCTWFKSVTVPESRGIYMGLFSDAAGGIDICVDTNQYMFFNKA